MHRCHGFLNKHTLWAQILLYQKIAPSLCFGKLQYLLMHLRLCDSPLDGDNTIETVTFQASLELWKENDVCQAHIRADTALM